MLKAKVVLLELEGAKLPLCKVAVQHLLTPRGRSIVCVTHLSCTCKFQLLGDDIEMWIFTVAFFFFPQNFAEVAQMDTTRRRFYGRTHFFAAASFSVCPRTRCLSVCARWGRSGVRSGARAS